MLPDPIRHPLHHEPSLAAPGPLHRPTKPRALGKDDTIFLQFVVRIISAQLSQILDRPDIPDDLHPRHTLQSVRKLAIRQSITTDINWLIPRRIRIQHQLCGTKPNILRGRDGDDIVPGIQRRDVEPRLLVPASFTLTSCLPHDDAPELLEQETHKDPTAENDPLRDGLTPQQVADVHLLAEETLAAPSPDRVVVHPVLPRHVELDAGGEDRARDLGHRPRGTAHAAGVDDGRVGPEELRQRRLVVRVDVAGHKLDALCAIAVLLFEFCAAGVGETGGPGEECDCRW